jgi:hypothetical protein
LSSRHLFYPKLQLGGDRPKFGRDFGRLVELGEKAWKQKKVRVRGFKVGVQNGLGRSTDGLDGPLEPSQFKNFQPPPSAGCFWVQDFGPLKRDRQLEVLAKRVRVGVRGLGSTDGPDGPLEPF